MASCEMCGKDLPSLRRALVEGTMMNVCPACVRFGVEQGGGQHEVTGRSRVTQSLERRAARGRSRDIYSEGEEELVLDYGERVRKARQRKGLSLEDLGKQISERVPTLAKVEGEQLHPPDTLVAKLEKALDVKLKEKPEPPASGGGAAKPGSAKALTLGDLIKQQLDKE